MPMDRATAVRRDLFATLFPNAPTQPWEKGNMFGRAAAGGDGASGGAMGSGKRYMWRR